MPAHVFKISMTRTLCHVDDMYIRVNQDQPTGFAKTTTDIGIFEIHKVATLIKPSDLLISVMPKYNKHASDPIYWIRRRPNGVISISLSKNNPFYQSD